MGPSSREHQLARPIGPDALDDLGIGFTGHAARLDADLVDMGGRSYHPRLGRFFSPDPLVISPFDAQAYNRYAYVLNRPLAFTDPFRLRAAGRRWRGGWWQPRGPAVLLCRRQELLPRHRRPQALRQLRPRPMESDAAVVSAKAAPASTPTTRTPPTASATAPTRANPAVPQATPSPIAVTEDMCAEIAACSGRQTKRGRVYIWHADIDEGARIALDIATDFIPGVAHAKTAYDAYSRIQNGEDPVQVLAAAGAEAALGLIPGLKAAKKIDKTLDKAEKVADVADAAGDVADAAGDLARRAGHNGVQGPPRVTTRTTRGGEKAARVEFPDKSVLDVSSGRVKEYVPNAHPKAPPGSLRKVRFESSQPGTKGYKRDPATGDLEWLE